MKEYQVFQVNKAPLEAKAGPESRDPGDRTDLKVVWAQRDKKVIEVSQVLQGTSTAPP